MTISLWTLVSGDTTTLILGLGAGLACLELSALWARHGGFSASALAILIINGVLLAGLVLWPFVAHEAAVAANIPYDKSSLMQAAGHGMLFSVALTLGALALRGSRHRSRGFAAVAEASVPTGLLTAFSYLVMVLVIVGYGPVLLRGEYLGGSGPAAAVIAGNALAPAALLAACVVAFRSGGSRILAAFSVVLWTLILFGRSSRALAALPTFLFVGWLMAGRHSVRWWHIALIAASTLFLLQLPISTRANEGGVGVLTLVELAVADPVAVFGGFEPSAILGNVLFSAPLTGYVGAQALDIQLFWISVSPEGGGAAGWAAVAPTLRVNVNTPYNGIGELAAYGSLALVCTGFVAGLVLSFSERVSSGLSGAFRAMGLLMTTAVSALYAVNLLQYNLRSSTRLLWYLIAGVAAIWAIAMLSTLLERRKTGADIGQELSRRPSGRRGVSRRMHGPSR